ncbi:HD domain-containing phosphohydrolase [Oceanispirochaeta sp.]|jgi:response regulator RpfG family c-di-GMP phosphodiesterase|uniref:HD-GYP domain-containing protein n=1 Tax=Oceanispirochaeta sp. TaxID=2035350 RepID=UPI00261C0144|nr:HD domain-containing phosphohydrolase [Oceanispirochaeta sp.]MDA3956977.1 HD domain-containing protein [Oceanispirochaeta sp.]
MRQHFRIPYHLYMLKLRNLMIKKEEQGRTDSLIYWQQYIFVSLMSTIVTLGLGVLITGINQFIKEDMLFAGLGLLGFYIFFLIMSFARFIQFKLRNKLIAWGFYSLSIILLIFTGPSGAGLLYLCTAFVLLLLHTDKDNSRQIIIINALVFLLLSLLFVLGKNPSLRFREYEQYWWLIVINSITVSIFIVQMINLIMKGLNRRYKKAERSNARLIRTQKENMKQIHMLDSLRQSGMVVMDSRLAFEERLQSALQSIRDELHCSALNISMVQGESENAICIASFPEYLNCERTRIPEIDGPYLLHDFEHISEIPVKTEIMKGIRPGELYFSSHFYTPDATGYLELLLNGNPDESELNFLQMSLFELSAAITNDQLIQDIKRSRDILEGSYDEILHAWARILELRDIETRGHSGRVVSICLNIAEKVNLPLEDQIQLKRGAFLHDIGKLGIPDSILKKEGPLTENEWTLMRRHPEIGRDSVKNIPFLRPAIPVIYYHHERWDGQGYPEGLKGDGIPYTARIFMIADIYDALISDRPYRKAMSQSDITDYMCSERGTFFDPELIDIFLNDVNNLTSPRIFDDNPIQ